MWASFAINRPLTWASLAALLACIWLPNPGLRLVAVGIAAFGIIDAWRQVQRDRQHAELMQQALMLSEEECRSPTPRTASWPSIPPSRESPASPKTRCGAQCR